MQIANTNGTSSVADGTPDLVKTKDPVSEKTITAKSITEDLVRCGHLKNIQFPGEGCTVTTQANQARINVNLKEINEDIRINHEEMNSNQERTIAEMDTWPAEMRGRRKDNGLPRSDKGLSGE
jgi:hypothetical protein